MKAHSLIKFIFLLATLTMCWSCQNADKATSLNDEGDNSQQRVSSQGVRSEEPTPEPQQQTSASQGATPSVQGCLDDVQHPFFPKWAQKHLDLEFMEHCGVALGRTHAVKVRAAGIKTRNCDGEGKKYFCGWLLTDIPLGLAHNLNRETLGELILVDQDCHVLKIKDRGFASSGLDDKASFVYFDIDEDVDYSSDDYQLRAAFNICPGTIPQSSNDTIPQ